MGEQPEPKGTSDLPKLTGHDYMTKPLLELAGHPDFSNHAYRVIDRISTMNTKELEKLNLIQGVK